MGKDVRFVGGQWRVDGDIYRRTVPIKPPAKWQQFTEPAKKKPKIKEAKTK